jgi:hypothetical protein
VTTILKKVENSYSTINYWLKSDKVYQRMLKLNKKFVIDLNTTSESSSDVDETRKTDNFSEFQQALKHTVV